LRVFRRASRVELRMRTMTTEQIARLQQSPDAPKQRRFRRPRLTRDPVYILLTLGVLALIFAMLGSGSNWMPPPINPEATPAKTIKTEAIPRAT
jgi:hypothetical protein